MVCFSPERNENNNWLPIITRGICKQLEVQFSLCWQILRTLLCAKVKAEIQGRLNKKKFYKYTYKWFLNLDHCGDRIKAFTELIQVPLSKGTGNIIRTIGKATDSQLLLSYYSTVIPPSGRIKGFRTYMFGVLGFWNPFFSPVHKIPGSLEVLWFLLGFTTFAWGGTLGIGYLINH